MKQEKNYGDNKTSPVIKKKQGQTKAKVPIKNQRLKPVAKRVITIVLAVVTLLSTTIMALLNYKPFSQGGIADNLKNDDKLKEDFMNILICGIDEKNDLTDVMMVVSFNIKENKINILQIPRDTYIGPDYMTYKANAAYAKGPDSKNKIGNLIEVIKNQFGMPIDHYATINMKGFRRAVDAIGGVEVNMPYAIPAQNKVHKDISIATGKQKLNGKQAEVLVRHREYTFGDIDRAKTQRVFVSSLVNQIKKAGTGELMNLLTSVMGYLTSDMSVNDIYKIGNAAMKVNMDEMEMYILPGETFNESGTSYYSIHIKQHVELLNKKFRPFQEAITEKDLSAFEVSNKYDYHDNTGNSVKDIIDGTDPRDETITDKEKQDKAEE